jgi:hypothetical protein
MARRIGRKHPDLAVGDFARRAGVLTSDTARGLALLEETRLVDHQHRIRVGQDFQDIVVHDVDQGSASQ